MAQDKPYKRRKVFIKRGYQFKFILKFCLILVAGGIISTGLMLLLSRGTLTTSFEHGRLIVKSTATAILPTVVLTNVLTLAIVTVIAVITVLYVSHKVAGPMFRFEKELSAVKEGDLTTQVNLRKKDQFILLSQRFNEMTQSLHKKVQSVESAILELEERIKKQDSNENVIAELERLRIALLGHFKL